MLDHAAAHDGNAIRQDQCLDLIMRDIDHGRTKAAMKPLQLDAQLGSKLGIEIGERLVEQEDIDITYESAADGDALALTAGKFARPPLAQGIDLQDPHGAVDALSELVLSHAGDAKPEGEISLDRHRRIERIGLEDHADAAILRLLPGNVLVADPDLPVADIGEARNGVEQGRLAAAGRA
ncbi:hypothetical protein RHSP_55751 [Rhizobium freirei PRF 81]|uniref:Uncharacterized protein n=1 Tax=Rhizobium freirei PRF 81 TaxID=363754 RepID=N6U4G0_9HYPH|nr:hypothetical protein RHSP_55751 [Rhizobium freirei PRF 81]